MDKSKPGREAQAWGRTCSARGVAPSPSSSPFFQFSKATSSRVRFWGSRRRFRGGAKGRDLVEPWRAARPSGGPRRHIVPLWARMRRQRRHGRARAPPATPLPGRLLQGRQRAAGRTSGGAGALPGAWNALSCRGAHGGVSIGVQRALRAATVCEPGRTGRFVLMLPHSGTGRAAYACSARQLAARQRSRREAAHASAWRQHANGQAADSAKLPGGSEPTPGTHAGTRAARCTQRSTRRGSYARRTARVVNVVMMLARVSACAGRGSNCGPRDGAQRQHSFCCRARRTARGTHHQLVVFKHPGWFRQ